MKKYTIQQFADVIRKKYPGKYDSITDNDLVFKWLKKYYGDAKYIEPTELAKLGYDLGKGQAEKATDYIKDKSKDYIPSDSTVQDLKTKLSDFIDKVKPKSDSTTQSSDTSTPEQTPTTKIVTQYPLPPKPAQAFKSKPCDENTYPWTKGCMNNKIGQMNQVYFGDTYNNIYGNQLYNELLSLGYFSAPGQKDGEITKFIYDEVMKDSLQENKKLNRKKIVKETVKNVLKERLKNN